MFPGEREGREGGGGERKKYSKRFLTCVYGVKKVNR